MMINKCFAILLLLVLVPCTAQERKNFVGRIVAAGAPAQNIFVLNKATGTEVKSGTDGTFTLPARVGDRLAVYGSTIVQREFTLNKHSFEQQPYEMEAEPQGIELKDVEINGGVTSESLGIVPKGQKQYTPAERKLATAGSAKMNPMGLDPIINAISGRTKMLKKAFETETKEHLAQQINDSFTDDELKSFGIPAEQARGFIFYIVEDPRVTDAFKAGNKDLVRLLLMELAEKYSNLQQKP